MQCKVWKSFAGTEGAWEGIHKSFVFDFDVEKCPYLGDESFTSFPDFKKGKITHKKQQVIDRLEKLAQHLQEVFHQKIDPIEYLIFLYYKEELSVEEIFERHFDFWYRNSSSLWHIMTHSLKWELRDRTEFNERRLKQKRWPQNPALTGLQANATKLKEDTMQKCLEILKWMTENIEEDSFSRETFDSFTGKWSKGKKVWYILKYLHGINPDIIYQINTQHDMWARTFARIINTKVESSCVLHDIPYIGLSLQAADISYIFQMKKKGKTLEIESL